MPTLEPFSSTSKRGSSKSPFFNTNFFNCFLCRWILISYLGCPLRFIVRLFFLTCIDAPDSIGTDLYLKCVLTKVVAIIDANLSVNEATTLLATIWPATKLRFKALGFAALHGHTLTKPAASEFTTVTFRAVADALRGIWVSLPLTLSNASCRAKDSWSNEVSLTKGALVPSPLIRSQVQQHNVAN